MLLLIDMPRVTIYSNTSIDHTYTHNTLVHVLYMPAGEIFLPVHGQHEK